MRKFYVVVAGDPREQAALAAVLTAGGETSEDSDIEPAAFVTDLKDKITVLGCYLDQNTAEEQAKKAAGEILKPVSVLSPFVVFEAGERPIDSTRIY